MVTAEREGHRITRNSSFFKRVPFEFVSADDTDSDDEELLREDVNLETRLPVQQPVLQDHMWRVRNLPVCFNDYVIGI